jgi:hypothetical protein
MQNALLESVRKKIHRYRRRVSDTGPYHIFVGYGGSGSSYLITVLDAFGRPDVWQPSYSRRPIVEWKHYAKARGVLLDERGYETTNVNWKDFNLRTKNKFKGQIDPTKTIRENLVNFCHWLENTNYKVFFVHTAIMNFFSNNNIRNVTYLIRHPLHAYVSFSKKGRHRSEINMLGGMENARAIEFWADRWNRQIEDYLKSVAKKLDPILIRYEHVAQDRQASVYHQRVFKYFDGSRRNYGILSDEKVEYLKSLVSDNYFEIYQEWDV